MSLGVLRAAALALGIVAFLSRFAVTWWLAPVTDRIEPAGLGLPLHLLALVVTVVAPLVVFTRVVVPPRRRPATFRVDAAARRFVVGAFPRFQGGLTIVFLWAAAGLVVVERGPERDVLGFNDWPSETYHGALFAVVVGFALTAPFLQQASFVLEPAGVSVHGPRGKITIDWDDLAPGGPPPPAPVSPRITLYRRGWHPWSGHHPARTEELPVGLLNVQPDFLAAAIREYVAHPSLRAGIGTATELTRLHADLPTRPDGQFRVSGTSPGGLT
ncbi:hypothetical protein GCM10022225_62220 [Plantactinospora mayteni]|uniref:Uncharacterized protein n=1 Tax=Plantactinospora mayteni TaxID=566021 RepID=A0ABQ4EZG1_9ACTN|nr:hypothetical protein [Plantactinospora mayteni]GIH00036.1 hypothetical protein Pma05_66080 [Plantactinospora mayteni]